MFILSDAGTSLFEFHPERLQDPAIIVGIILMVLGLLCALLAKSIASIPVFKKWEEKNNTNKSNGSIVESISRIAGAIVIFIGIAIVLILGK